MLERGMLDLSALAADESTTFMAAALAVNSIVSDEFDRVGTERALGQLTGRYDDRLTPWAFLREEGFGGRSPVDVVQGSCIERSFSRRGTR